MAIFYGLFNDTSVSDYVVACRPVASNDHEISNCTTAIAMVFSVRSVPMAAHATLEYITPLLSNNCTAAEKRCFLCGPCPDVISRTVSKESVSAVEWS
jgi:hypothetical protein